MYSWLDDIVAQYPDVASTIIGGSTYEGRQIRGVKLSFKEVGNISYMYAPDSKLINYRVTVEFLLKEQCMLVNGFLVQHQHIF